MDTKLTFISLLSEKDILSETDSTYVAESTNSSESLYELDESAELLSEISASSNDNKEYIILDEVSDAISDAISDTVSESEEFIDIPKFLFQTSSPQMQESLSQVLSSMANISISDTQLDGFDRIFVNSRKKAKIMPKLPSM